MWKINECYIQCSRLLNDPFVLFRLTNPLETIDESDKKLDAFQDQEMVGIRAPINDQRISNGEISDSEESEASD